MGSILNSNIIGKRKRKFTLPGKVKPVVPADPPAAPSNLTLVDFGETTTELSWDASPDDVDYYTLYAKYDPIGDYITRVQADGGQITDTGALTEFVTLLVEQGLWPYVQGLISPAFGIKLDGTDVDKLYNVRRASDFTPKTSKATFSSEGQGGKAIVSGGQRYIAGGDLNWLRNVNQGWGIFTGDLPFDNSNNGFGITSAEPGTRFRLYRASSDNRFDIIIVPEETFLILGNNKDDAGELSVFDGFFHLGNNEAGSYINNVQQVYAQTPVIPDMDFPNMGTSDIYLDCNDIGLQLFVTKKPTEAQRTAVFNWINKYYRII